MHIGQNIEAKQEGDKLILTIDTAQRLARSKTGKSVIVATTSGNVKVTTPKGELSLGLNAYIKD